MRAFDTSRFATNNNPISVVTAQKLNQVFDLAVIGAWHGTVGYDAAEASLLNCRENFMYIATYAALAANHDPVAAINECHARCGAQWANLLFCAVDVELDGVTHDQIAAAVERIVALGQKPIIYTSKYKWQSILNDTPDFARLGVKLWDAKYDGSAALDDFISGAYGGWTWDTLLGHQYTNTTPFADISVDYNVFDDRLVQAIPSSLVGLATAWATDMQDVTDNAQLLVHIPLNTTALALHSIYAANRARAWDALLGKQVA